MPHVHVCCHFCLPVDARVAEGFRTVAPEFSGSALAMTASVYRKIIASPGVFGFVRPCREAPAGPFEQVQYRDEP
ncbi:hypothetical protein PAMC26577_36230 [Caballeronia sordidicola]|uniref:Uncharacterized protein n=1 Tax=Caballeronia sordidicola TaxID=196367 RepID=A0A242M8N0_CABSO|nr:hypothetical protein PAMC26577_36230 [Caballeronia sordidicola]